MSLSLGLWYCLPADVNVSASWLRWLLTVLTTVYFKIAYRLLLKAKHENSNISTLTTPTLKYIVPNLVAYRIGVCKRVCCVLSVWFICYVNLLLWERAILLHIIDVIHSNESTRKLSQMSSWSFYSLCHVVINSQNCLGGEFLRQYSIEMDEWFMILSRMTLVLSGLRT